MLQLAEEDLEPSDDGEEVTAGVGDSEISDAEVVDPDPLGWNLFYGVESALSALSSPLGYVINHKISLSDNRQPECICTFR